MEGAGGVATVDSCGSPIFKRRRRFIGSKIVIVKIDANIIKKTDAMIIRVR